MSIWIDTHCHLDADEFALDALAVRARALRQGVALCVIPAVHTRHFARVRALAHQTQDAYALGIHPLYTPQAVPQDLDLLAAELLASLSDPRLVAVGEIGLDYFVPELDAEHQELFFSAQLRLAQRHGLPVILHVRRSVDRVIKCLRQIRAQGWHGIAHAFNGSEQQAHTLIQMGFKLGFGGAVTFERASQLRHLAASLPLSALMLETDAPDMPPHWIYQTAQQRANGTPQGRNEPGELPRIAAVVAGLRGMDAQALADATWRNTLEALPRLEALL